MKVCSINNNTEYRYSLNKQHKEEREITFSFVKYVVPYSCENLKANFVISFKGEKTPIDELMDFFSERGINEFVSDTSFTKRKDFDAKGWLEFLKLADEYEGSESDESILDTIVRKPSFSDNLNSDYSPRRARDFLENEELDDEFYYEDFLMLMDYYAKSDIDLEEYISDITYFKSLKDKEGNPLMTPKNMFFEEAEILTYMLSIDKGSVDASNFQMLLELVQNGEVNSSVFKFLPQKGELNPDIVSDIDKLYQAYIDGKKSIDVFVPLYKTLNEALEETSKGDVFAVEGQKNAYVINRRGKPKKLNISRQMCYDLFPPVERFSTTQNDIGNCWEISGFTSLYSDVDTRADILNLFTQKGNDVYVEFPQSSYGRVKFQDAKLPEQCNNRFFSYGAIGFQMLEWADAKELYTIRLNELYSQLKKSKNLSDEDKNFIRRIKRNKYSFIEESKLVIEKDNKTDCYTYRKFDEKLDKNGDCITSTRDKGNIRNLYQRLGYDVLLYMLDNKSSQDEISNPLLFDISVVSLLTNLEKDVEVDDNPNFVNELSPDKSKAICYQHYYRLIPATIDKTGKITDYYIYNPYGATREKVSREEILKWGKGVVCAVKVDDED